MAASKHANLYVEPVSERQIEIYRRMTGEQRLRLGFEMSEAIWRAEAEAIEKDCPGISDAGLKGRIRQRRAAIYRHEAEFRLWQRLLLEAAS